MAYIGKTPTIGNFQKCDAITVVNGQAAYTLQVGGTNVVPESVNHMLVSLNGILQAPTDSFTVSGSTLTFASNLATGDVIDFVMILGNVLDLGVPSDNTVTAAKLNNDIISGQTALATAPDDTDEFLVSDAGTIKRIDYSLIKGGGGLVHIKTQTISSSVTSVQFIHGTSDVVFDGTYKAYKLIITGGTVVNDTQKPFIRFTQGSGFITSGYSFSGLTRSAANSDLSFHSNSDSDIRMINDGIGNASDETFSIEVNFNNPATTDVHKLIHGTVTGIESDGNTISGFFGGGYLGNTSAITGFEIAVGSGNIDGGTFSLFGVVNS